MTTATRLPTQITTARLLLRACDPQLHAADQVATVRASLAELSPWLPWAGGPQTLEEAQANLQAAAESFADGSEYNYVLHEQRHGTFVGRVSLFRIEPSVPRGEIGYWLSSDHTGLGYMREAVAALAQQSVAAGFRRLEIRCDALNVRSAAVAEAAGFQKEALLRQNEVSQRDPGQLRDTLIYALLR